MIGMAILDKLYHKAKALPTRPEPTPMSLCGSPKSCDISLNMIHNCNLFAYANSSSLFACE